jgi:hypothetical protein
MYKTIHDLSSMGEMCMLLAVIERGPSRGGYDGFDG